MGRIYLSLRNYLKLLEVCFLGLLCHITARQYGEVVFPLFSQKSGMAHFLPYRHRVLWPLQASRYRVVKELVNYLGAVKFIEGSGAVRICQALRFCLGGSSKSKNRDNLSRYLGKQLTHIVRIELNPAVAGWPLSKLDFFM